jgi:hypothetical protein
LSAENGQMIGPLIGAQKKHRHQDGDGAAVQQIA